MSKMIKCRVCNGTKREPTGEDTILICNSCDANGEVVCDHAGTKVYSTTVLMSYPKQHPWICAACLEEGCDVERRAAETTYEELVRRKKEKA